MYLPANDWILVELIPLPERTRGGIIVPMGAGGSDQRLAVVVASGPGKARPEGERAPTGVAPGDLVAFDRWHTQHQNGTAVCAALGAADSGRELAMVKPEDILCVIEEYAEEGLSDTDLYAKVFG